MNILANRLINNGSLEQDYFNIILKFLRLFKLDVNDTLLTQFFNYCFEHNNKLNTAEVKTYAKHIIESNFSFEQDELDYKIKKLKEMNIPELYGIQSLLLLLSHKENKGNEVDNLIDHFTEDTFGYDNILFSNMKIGTTNFYAKYKEILFDKFIRTNFVNEKNLNNKNIRRIIKDNIYRILSKSKYIKEINKKLYYVDPVIIYYLFKDFNYTDLTTNEIEKTNFNLFDKIIILSIDFSTNKTNKPSKHYSYNITPIKQKPILNENIKQVKLINDLPNPRIYETDIIKDGKNTNYIAFIDHTFDNEPIALYNICNADNPYKDQYIYEFLIYLKKKYPYSKYLTQIKENSKVTNIRFSPIYLVNPKHVSNSVFNSDQEDVSLRELRFVNSFFIYTIAKVEELELKHSTDDLVYDVSNYENNLLLNSLYLDHKLIMTQNTKENLSENFIKEFINKTNNNRILLNNINTISKDSYAYYSYTIDYFTYVNSFMCVNTLAHLYNNKGGFRVNKLQFDKISYMGDTLSVGQDIVGSYLNNGMSYNDLFSYFFLPDNTFELYTGIKDSEANPPKHKYTLSFAGPKRFHIENKELAKLYDVKLSYKNTENDKIIMIDEMIKRKKRYIMSFIYFNNVYKDVEHNTIKEIEKNKKSIDLSFNAMTAAYGPNDSCHMYNLINKKELIEYDIAKVTHKDNIPKQKDYVSNTNWLPELVTPNRKFNNNTKQWEIVEIPRKTDAFIMNSKTRSYSLAPHNAYVSEGKINEIINVNKYILKYTVDPTNKYKMKLLTPPMKMVFKLDHYYYPVHQYKLNNCFNNSFHNVYVDPITFETNYTPLAFNYRKQNPAQNLNIIKQKTLELIYNNSKEIYTKIFSSNLDKLKFVEKATRINESI